MRSPPPPENFTIYDVHERYGDWWHYIPPSDDGDPTEPKAADWGMLRGELVSIDYSAPALTAFHKHRQREDIGR